MEKRKTKGKVSLTSERKFKVNDIKKHVSMFFKKFREGKNPKTKFYTKRGR